MRQLNETAFMEGVVHWKVLLASLATSITSATISICHTETMANLSGSREVLMYRFIVSFWPLPAVTIQTGRQRISSGKEL